MNSWAIFIGRIFLAVIFLVSAFSKIINLSRTQTYMASFGMPTTTFFAVCAIFLETTGAISLLLGYKTKWGAFLLILFLMPVTLIFHTKFSDPSQVIMFLKNLAIIGGLLQIVGSGAGSISLDARTKK